ncbi:MAG: efflux RND transporter permease subunit, partial [Algiphilus sp.]|nr:efflux RND transporter permease subunit [Algiphilus sp.]
ESEWRPGMTLEDIRAEIRQRVDIPGLTNAWVMPIRTRIDMLATGIKTPVGIKIRGPELTTIQDIGRQIETIVGAVEGTVSVFAERVAGGRYVTIDIDRDAAGRYGLNVAELHTVVQSAIGGMNLTETVEGRERYPVNLRYPQAWRGSPEAMRHLPLMTPNGQWIVLGDVADIRIEAGAPVIKSENARLSGWVYVDIAGRDLGSYVEAAKQRVSEQLELPPGYSLVWSGQYEYMQRAAERLRLVVPATLAVIVMLLYLAFRQAAPVLIILATVPLSLAGGFWLLYALGFSMSIAVAVGFIALAGVAVEISVVMLSYLRQECRDLTDDADRNAFVAAVETGAQRRLRPVVMTATATIAGLIPIMLSSGTGSEVMRRIAAPMVGGMVTTLLLALLLLPAVYVLTSRPRPPTAGERGMDP